MQKQKGFILPIIIVSLVVVILGAAGYFAYKQYSVSKEPEQTACTQEAKLCPDGSSVGRAGPNCEFADCPAITNEAKLTSFEIIPSCNGNAGGIIYPIGAKAVAKGKNLTKIEFWIAPPGTGIGDVLYNQSLITKNSDQWEAILPSDMWVIDLYVVGYDSDNNKVGKIAIGKSIYGPTSSGGSPNATQYPKDCKTDQTADSPVIDSISPNFGLKGTVVEIRGKNLSGFEGDLDIYFERADGKTIMLTDNFGDYSKTGGNLIKVKVIEPCQRGEKVIGRYSGIESECNYIELTPGTYKVYAKPWGKKSNTVFFTITK
ncbi:MAG: Uncharacterized protein CEN87_66 [Parcubacteria group bacterium Licking1014_1]|nr:MAG: Uncharacterized protein CEN87_66 [Parcubacteria group bacterium Licking1014_1]